jgi:hypothetical protein
MLGMNKDLAPLRRTIGKVLIVVSYHSLLLFLDYFLSLISLLDHLYDRLMLKFDMITIIFLCIAMLLYVGNTLTQHCIETLLTFFDWALKWVKRTP